MSLGQDYLKVQQEILENANFSLIALKANVPHSLKSPSKATHPAPKYAHRLEYQRQHYVGVVRTGVGNHWATSCVIHHWKKCIVQLIKVLQYKEGRLGCWCLSAILALSALGAQRYANAYFDKQVGKPIKMLRPSVHISWSHTFHWIYK